MNVTLYWIAERYIGVKEVPGTQANPLILSWLQHDQGWPQDDDVPWCSGWLNVMAWQLRLPRSKSLRARSWLGVGQAIELHDARPAFDVVILKRSGDDEPGPEVINAPGHVGLYSGRFTNRGGHRRVHLLGGNQGDSVSVAQFDEDCVLGVRRLWQPTS